jgi:argininosuccinate lyase
MSERFSRVYVDRVLEPSYRNWKRLYCADAMDVHKAHLVMLRESGIVPPAVSEALKRGIDALEASCCWPDSIPDGAEDLYCVFEEKLELAAGAENAAWLHTARSRNDMDTTVFRLALLRALRGFLEELAACCTACMERARAGVGELTVLFTHGQPANVSTMAHYLSGFLLELLEGADALIQAMDSVDRCTLGACAITGTGFSIDRDRTARLLGFRAPVPNTYQAISTSHWLIRPAAAMRLLLSDAARLAADLLHKSSCEVGLVEFPDDLVQSSSIMPQKRNPVVLEHIRIQAGLASGVCFSIEDLFHGVPFQDVNEVADAPVTDLLGAIATAGSCFALVAETVYKLRSNAARAREIAVAFGVTTTELADTMVRECGIGFRAAHRICSAFARSCGDKAKLRAAFREATGADLAWTDSRIDECLDPGRFIAVRRTAGGPAPEGMASVFAAAEAGLSRLRAALDEMRERNARAARELATAWKGLA